MRQQGAVAAAAAHNAQPILIHSKLKVFPSGRPFSLSLTAVATAAKDSTANFHYVEPPQYGSLLDRSMFGAV